mmetsp:Transcript_22134/g.57751  ORF Transcript_22134/g.57751 Transcript_22134/m.57751 type:complete len:244 (+) Transcript_22134:594-1325(+)
MRSHNCDRTCGTRGAGCHATHDERADCKGGVGESPGEADDTLGSLGHGILFPARGKQGVGLACTQPPLGLAPAVEIWMLGLADVRVRLPDVFLGREKPQPKDFVRIQLAFAVHPSVVQGGCKSHTVRLAFPSRPALSALMGASLFVPLAALTTAIANDAVDPVRIPAALRLDELHLWLKQHLALDNPSAAACTGIRWGSPKQNSAATARERSLSQMGATGENLSEASRPSTWHAKSKSQQHEG